MRKRRESEEMKDPVGDETFRQRGKFEKGRGEIKRKITLKGKKEMGKAA